MAKFLGVIGLRGGVSLFGGPESEPQRSFESRRKRATRLSVVSVVSALESELRGRWRTPTGTSIQRKGVQGMSKKGGNKPKVEPRPPMINKGPKET
jgi:hypothetical protein